METPDSNPGGRKELSEEELRKKWNIRDYSGRT